MMLFVAGILVGAVFYFAWRHSPSQPKRVVAMIGGVLAVMCVLLAIYGLIAYWRTVSP